MAAVVSAEVGEFAGDVEDGGECVEEELIDEGVDLCDGEGFGGGAADFGGEEEEFFDRLVGQFGERVGFGLGGFHGGGLHGVEGHVGRIKCEG